MNRIKHKVLFQMDPFNKLNIKTDSTISIIKEALILGIEVYVSSPNDLTLMKNNAFVTFREVTFIKSKFSFSKQKNSSINKFDYFFIRQDPPFDLKYLTNCYLLELHQKFNKKPRFINDPGGIKNFSPQQLKEKNKSQDILKLAVKRMLPGGPLSKKQLTKLKLYQGENHPHELQKPKIINFENLNSKNIVK